MKTLTNSHIISRNSEDFTSEYMGNHITEQEFKSENAVVNYINVILESELTNEKSFGNDSSVFVAQLLTFAEVKEYFSIHFPKAKVYFAQAMISESTFKSTTGVVDVIVIAKNKKVAWDMFIENQSFRTEVMSMGLKVIFPKPVIDPKSLVGEEAAPVTIDSPMQPQRSTRPAGIAFLLRRADGSKIKNGRSMKLLSMGDIEPLATWKVKASIEGFEAFILTVKELENESKLINLIFN